MKYLFSLEFIQNMCKSDILVRSYLFLILEDFQSPFCCRIVSLSCFLLTLLLKCINISYFISHDKVSYISSHESSSPFCSVFPHIYIPVGVYFLQLYIIGYLSNQFLKIMMTVLWIFSILLCSFSKLPVLSLYLHLS